MQLNPAIVLQSHIRASARPAEIIADQITVSNSFNRRILSFVESSSTSSFCVGSVKNRLIISCSFWGCDKVRVNCELCVGFENAGVGVSVNGR